MPALPAFAFAAALDYAPKPAMSNQAGIAIPLLSVTGRVGAVGQTNFTWSSCTAGPRLLILAPLLPRLQHSVQTVSEGKMPTDSRLV